MATPGNIYLVVFADRPYCKLGRTGNVRQRCSAYGTHAKLLQALYVTDMMAAERHMLQLCREHPQLIARRDIGYEYFQGPIRVMLRVMRDTLAIYGNLDPDEREARTIHTEFEGATIGLKSFLMDADAFLMEPDSYMPKKELLSSFDKFCKARGFRPQRITSDGLQGILASLGLREETRLAKWPRDSNRVIPDTWVVGVEPKKTHPDEH